MFNRIFSLIYRLKRFNKPQIVMIMLRLCVKIDTEIKTSEKLVG